MSHLTCRVKKKKLTMTAFGKLLLQIWFWLVISFCSSFVLWNIHYKYPFILFGESFVDYVMPRVMFPIFLLAWMLGWILIAMVLQSVVDDLKTAIQELWKGKPLEEAPSMVSVGVKA